MNCKCSAPHFSFGKSFFRSFSVCSTLLPSESFQRFASLCMCVSTGNAGVPKACTIITDAVLCPTPGNASNSSKVRGTLPPYLSLKIFAVWRMFFAFEFDSPHGFIISRISDSESFAIFSGVSATAKSLGVTSFTRLSVH